jgi:hypothetical protein
MGQTVVYPEDGRLAVQAAVNVPEATVLLKATDRNGNAMAFNFGNAMVTISKPGVVLESADANARATIKGNGRATPYLLNIQAYGVTVRNLNFEGSGRGIRTTYPFLGSVADAESISDFDTKLTRSYVQNPRLP